MSKQDQLRSDEFEDLVCQFLKESSEEHIGNIGIDKIERHPRVGDGKADFLVGSRKGEGFFVEAKSPNLRKWTAFDEEHLARVRTFEASVERLVKKFLGEIHQACILIGDWDGFLAREVEDGEIKKSLAPIKDWVGREQELPTRKGLDRWHVWLRVYEPLKAYIESKPELDGQTVERLKTQCPGYDQLPRYPFGDITVSIPQPKQGKPQQWRCRWRLVRRDRFYPVGSKFTWFSGGGSAGSCHRIEPTVRAAIKEYKQKLRQAKEEPTLPSIPLVLFVDGRTAGHYLTKDDLDLAFAGGIWEGRPFGDLPACAFGGSDTGSPRARRARGCRDFSWRLRSQPLLGEAVPLCPLPSSPEQEATGMECCENAPADRNVIDMAPGGIDILRSRRTTWRIP